jgi:flagellar biosynthesis protein FliQ
MNEVKKERKSWIISCVGTGIVVAILAAIFQDRELALMATPCFILPAVKCFLESL